MELWVYFILGFTSLAAVTSAIDLNESNKSFRGLDEKFGEISKEHQEIKKEVQKLSKKLAK